VNASEIVWLLTWLNALIVTDWDDTDWEGDPDIIPVDELKIKPVGSNPDMIEKDCSSPSTVGEIQNGLFFDRT